MSARFEDALQDCLERIEAGTPASEAMALHPELRHELEPRLMAALTARAKRPLMPTAQRAALRARLTALDETNGIGERWPIRMRVGWRRPTRLVAGALAAIALVLVGLHGASANSRPGDFLYPVKVGIQRLRGAVLEHVEEAVPGPGSGDDAGGAGAMLTPSPTATVVVRQSAAPWGPTGPSAGAPSALATSRPSPTGLSEKPDSKPGGTIPALPAATATLAPGVGPAATVDLGTPSHATSPTQPTLAPPTVLPTPSEYPQVSTGAIEGTVSGPEGQPLDGASVIVQTVHFAMPGSAGPGQLKATTDSAGRYRIDGVPIGTHLVFVRVGHRIVWYPGRMDRQEAGEVKVDPRQTTTGVDVRMDQLDSGSRGRRRHATPP